MKICKIISILTILATLFLHKDNTATAQAYRECYWVNSEKKIVSFPSYMCGSQTQPSENQNPTNITDPVDREFIKKYQDLADSQQEPIVRTLLLRTIQYSPTNEIAQAKKICSTLKVGTSLKEIIATEAKELGTDPDSSASKVNLRLESLRNVLAIECYCPEFSSEI